MEHLSVKSLVFERRNYETVQKAMQCVAGNSAGVWHGRTRLGGRGTDPAHCQRDRLPHGKCGCGGGNRKQSRYHRRPHPDCLRPGCADPDGGAGRRLAGYRYHGSRRRQDGEPLHGAVVGFLSDRQPHAGWYLGDLYLYGQKRCAHRRHGDYPDVQGQLLL